MIKEILEQCQNGLHGVGFNEVVLMLYNPVATAEVYMDMDDVRFSDDENTVTFMVDNGTHLHMKLDQVKELRFKYTEKNERGEPSYSVWFLDENQESVLRIYLRKSETDATNQPRHQLFMDLLERYGESLQLAS
jgi:putative heme iron utilization protein